MHLINTEKQRAAIAPFETIEQLNANTKAIRAEFAECMTASEKAVLDILHTYASKHYGVSYLSKNSIAELVGLSRRQVIRICNKFENMGIIAQLETGRKAGGGQTSNTITFITMISAKNAFVEVVEEVVFEKDVTPVVTGLEALKDTPLKTKTLKHTDDTEAVATLREGLVTKLPKTLKHALAPFFATEEEVYEAVGTVYKAKASVDKNITIENNESTYYQVITSVMNAYKRGQVKNVNAVLYTAVASATRGIWLQERSEYFGF